MAEDDDARTAQSGDAGLDRAIAIYQRGGVTLAQAAAEAGVTYDEAFQECVRRRVVLMEDPDSPTHLETLGERYDLPALVAAARAVQRTVNACAWDPDAVPTPAEHAGKPCLRCGGPVFAYVVLEPDRNAHHRWHPSHEECLEALQVVTSALRRRIEALEGDRDR